MGWRILKRLRIVVIGDYERTAADSMTTLLRTDPSIVLVLRRRVRRAGGTAHFPAVFEYFSKACRESLWLLAPSLGSSTQARTPLIALSRPPAR